MREIQYPKILNNTRGNHKKIYKTYTSEGGMNVDKANNEKKKRE